MHLETTGEWVRMCAVFRRREKNEEFKYNVFYTSKYLAIKKKNMKKKSEVVVAGRADPRYAKGLGILKNVSSSLTCMHMIHSLENCRFDENSPTSG